jgi:predicted GNAT family acetyltransferase
VAKATNDLPDVTVRDNATELRYEALVDGQLLGLIRYRTEPGLVVLVHTEVEPSAEGTGVGSQLVAGALDDIRRRGLHVVPYCPFVAAYIRHHPEYADLVVTDPATPD